jgi:hypothetical protein
MDPEGTLVMAVAGDGFAVVGLGPKPWAPQKRRLAHMCGVIGNDLWT